jgi:uncharacterized protein
MSNPSRSSDCTRRLVLALPFALAATGVSAQGKMLDAPRASGQVGERFDGLAVVRDTANAATLGPMVEQVNAERRRVYAERAAADRVPVDQVGRVYAQEIVKSAPAGTWFLQESGQWMRK